MPLTPDTLTRHELVGLPVRVAAADNPDLVGIAGRVVDETMRTLRIDPDAAASRRGRSGGAATAVCVPFETDAEAGSGVRQVPKRGTTFEFALPAAPGGDDAATSSGGGGATAPMAEDRGATASPTDDRGAGAPQRTDEAAADRKAAGSTPELGSETAGVRPGQSGPSGEGPTGPSSASRGGTAPGSECEDVVYVTVDGATLLSRPATRTERAGDSTWQ